MEQTQEHGSGAGPSYPASLPPLPPPPLLPSLTLSHKIRPYEKKARDGVRLFGFAQHQYFLKPKHVADIFVWPCQRITHEMATFEFHLPETVPYLAITLDSGSFFYFHAGEKLFDHVVIREKHQVASC